MARNKRPAASRRPTSGVHPMVRAAVDGNFARALSLHKENRLTEAARLYELVLQSAPQHADALQLLGTLKAQDGNPEQALVLLRRAVQADAGHARAHNNLGKVLSQMGEHEQALESFERAVALTPGNAKAVANGGRSLRALDRLEEALDRFDRALVLEPGATDVLAIRAEVLERLGRTQEKWRERAVEALREVQPQATNAETFRYVLASLGGDDAPAAAPRDVVADLFDAYADRFDQHLVDVLKYRTPELIAEALARAGAIAGDRVLDLGCGTGLCGHFLRPLARRLTGVDLSSKMLDKARERNEYDDLVCAELLEHLQGTAERLHIVVAADVFVYVGDLSGVFAEVRRCLSDDGLFVFSVESCDGDGYQLMPTRRYTHSNDYLHRLAAEHGFAPPELRDVTLREQMQQPVAGLVAVCRPRPRTAP